MGGGRPAAPRSGAAPPEGTGAGIATRALAPAGTGGWPQPRFSPPGPRSAPHRAGAASGAGAGAGQGQRQGRGGEGQAGPSPPLSPLGAGPQRPPLGGSARAGAAAAAAAGGRGGAEPRGEERSGGEGREGSEGAGEGGGRGGGGRRGRGGRRRKQAPGRPAPRTAGRSSRPPLPVLVPVPAPAPAMKAAVDLKPTLTIIKTEKVDIDLFPSAGKRPAAPGGCGNPFSPPRFSARGGRGDGDLWVSFLGGVLAKGTRELQGSGAARQHRWGKAKLLSEHFQDFPPSSKRRTAAPQPPCLTLLDPERGRDKPPGGWGGGDDDPRRAFRSPHEASPRRGARGSPAPAANAPSGPSTARAVLRMHRV